MILTAQRGRIAAVLLLLLTAAVTERFVVEPLGTLYAERERKIALLNVRASRIAAQKLDSPGVQSALATLERSGQAAAVFWPGATDAVAAAGLQEKMQGILQAAGAVIDEAETLPSVTDGTLHRIVLKVQFSGDVDQVEHVVHAVESSKPSLVVDHLAIRKLNSTKVDAPELSVELRVFGFADPAHHGEPGA